MARKSMAQFLREHRAEIDKHIRETLGRVPSSASCDCPKNGTTHHHEPEGVRYNDHERRLWVLNDPVLYSDARREGVDL